MTGLKKNNRITRVGDSPFAWGERTYVMSVLNVTPDSFSGDGTGDDFEAAIEQAKQFQEWGAHIIDVGGESTRPPSLYDGAKPVSTDQELSRVIPVIETLSKMLRIPISIDTFKAKVAKEALKAGAAMVNDIWGLKRDPDMANVIADAGAVVVLMHNQSHTRYREVVSDVASELQRMTDHAVRAGIDRENVIIDPGIGFGKTAEQNLEVLRRLDELSSLDLPILVGTSRKSTIGLVLDLPVEDRIEGTAATVALSIARGADIVRVHDVKQMVRVAKMSDAIVRGWTRS